MPISKKGIALLGRILLFSFPVLLSPSPSQGEEDIYDLGKVVVTAGQIPMESSRLTRQVTAIDSGDIENAPVHSLPELLGYVAGVDVRRRGVEGVQADISIRGCNFEQTLILIDEVKTNNPQTGHLRLEYLITGFHLNEKNRLVLVH